jgi:hypothetical protein
MLAPYPITSRQVKKPLQPVTHQKVDRGKPLNITGETLLTITNINIYPLTEVGQKILNRLKQINSLLKTIEGVLSWQEQVHDISWFPVRPIATPSKA